MTSTRLCGRGRAHVRLDAGNSLREFEKTRLLGKRPRGDFKDGELTLSVSSLESDAEASCTWDYVSVLQGGVLGREGEGGIREAELREQTLLEKRCTICMTFGRVAPLSERVSFDELAIKFEASSPRTAESAPITERWRSSRWGLVELETAARGTH